MNLLQRARKILQAPRYASAREVLWFALITLSIHFLYRFWATDLQFQPVTGLMADLQRDMAHWVFVQATWVNANLLCLPMTLTGHTMTFANQSWITVNESCAGDKQILQFMLLLLVYPGPWRHKAWFIPLGMVILHATNILRIVLLSLVSVNMPDYWHIAHNTVLRWMFYLVILLLWIIWTEKFRKVNR